MHDGMPYDPIQGQGHETFKIRNYSIFKFYLLRHFNMSWQMTTDATQPVKSKHYRITQWLSHLLFYRHGISTPCLINSVISHKKRVKIRIKRYLWVDKVSAAANWPLGGREVVDLLLAADDRLGPWLADTLTLSACSDAVVSAEVVMPNKESSSSNSLVRRWAGHIINTQMFCISAK